jgi:hypothetical protein
LKLIQKGGREGCFTRQEYREEKEERERGNLTRERCTWTRSPERSPPTGDRRRGEQIARNRAWTLAGEKNEPGDGLGQRRIF